MQWHLYTVSADEDITQGKTKSHPDFSETFPSPLTCLPQNTKCWDSASSPFWEFKSQNNIDEQCGKSFILHARAPLSSGLCSLGKEVGCAFSNLTYLRSHIHLNIHFLMTFLLENKRVCFYFSV